MAKRTRRTQHQIKRAKFLKRKADFYFFLTYLPVISEHKISHFENKFLIVPSAELEKRMAVFDPGKNQIYSFCLHFEDGKVWGERVTVPHNKLTTYDEFLDA